MSTSRPAVLDRTTRIRRIGPGLNRYYPAESRDLQDCPQILDAHYPDHPDGRSVHQPRPRAQTPAEEAFLALGPGAHRWLIEAAAAGTSRVRRKMGHAVELAAALGADPVDQALGLAAMAGRFAEPDLDSICDHLAAAGPARDVVLPDETHSAQPGTSGWHRFGQQHDDRRGGR